MNLTFEMAIKAVKEDIQSDREFLDNKKYRHWIQGKECVLRILERIQKEQVKV